MRVGRVAVLESRDVGGKVSLVLDDAIGLVAPEVANRVAFFEAGHVACALCKQVAAAVVVFLRRVDLGHFVLVVGNVVADVVLEVVAYLVVPVEGHFNTGILDRTGVLQLRGEASRRRHRNRHEQVFGLLLVPVEIEAKLSGQQTCVKADVELFRRFPRKVFVGKTRERGTAHGRVFGVAERIVAVGVVCKGGLVLECGDVLVTVLTPAGTQFQEVNHVFHRLHEAFVADDPAGRERREVAPALSGSEHRGTVAADDCRQHVLFGVVIVHTTEVRHAARIGARQTRYRGRRVVLHQAHVCMVEVRDDCACCGCAELEAEVRAALAIFGTEEHVKVAVVDVEPVVQGVGGAPCPACANLVGGRLGYALVALVVQVIRTEEVAPRPGAQLVAHLTAIDKSLDGLHFQESHHVEVVVDTLVVGTLVVHQRCDRVGCIRCVIEETRVLQIVIAKVFAFAVVDGDKRIGAEHGGKLVGIHVAVVETLLLAMSVVEGFAHLDDIHAVRIAIEDVLGVQTQREAAEVRLGIVAAEHAVLILIAQTHRELRHVGTAGKVQRVAGRHGVLVAQSFNPVGSRILAALIVSKQLLVALEIISPVVSGFARIVFGKIHHLHIFLGSQHLRQTIDVGPAEVGIVAHLQLAGLALLGGHDDHTVGGGRTIDGARGGVLQHIDALDVGGVDVVDIATRHAVDDVERSRVAVGAGTANRHLETITWLTRRRLDGHTRRLALERAESLSGVELLNVLALDLDCGTSDEFLLLNTITGYHHFVQFRSLVFEADVDCRLTREGNFLRVETDERENDHIALSCVELILTVEIGNCTVGCPFDNNVDTRQGLIA